MKFWKRYTRRDRQGEAIECIYDYACGEEAETSERNARGTMRTEETINKRQESAAETETTPPWRIESTGGRCCLRFQRHLSLHRGFPRQRVASILTPRDESRCRLMIKY